MTNSEIQHEARATERREFWVAPTVNEFGHHAAVTTPKRPWLVHVREVRPGEITLTREEFRKAVDTARGRSPAELVSMEMAVEGLLFDLTPEGQQIGSNNEPGV